MTAPRAGPPGIAARNMMTPPAIVSTPSMTKIIAALPS
jgi:hypothetical protein